MAQQNAVINGQLTFTGSLAQQVSIASQPIGGNLLLLFPNILPSAGQTMNAVLVDGNVVTLGWANPVGADVGDINSITLAVPTELSVAGSPLTSSGTLTLSWGSASGNWVIASPAGGGSGAYAGRALVALDIPNLDAGKITTGALALARGGTHADLSGTGGAGQVLRQSSTGADVTVGTLASTDLSDTTALARLASPVFTTSISLNGSVTLLDGTGAAGSSTNLLSSTGTATAWLAQSSLTIAESQVTNLTTDLGSKVTKAVSVDTPGLTDNVTPTTLLTAPAGVYRVSAYNYITIMDGASSTLPKVTISWVDATSVTQTKDITGIVPVTTNAVGDFDQGDVIVVVGAGNNITYETQGYASGTSNFMTYNLRVRLEAL